MSWCPQDLHWCPCEKSPRGPLPDPLPHGGHREKTDACEPGRGHSVDVGSVGPWPSQPPKLWEIHFCGLSHPVCGIWLGQPKRAKVILHYGKFPFSQSHPLPPAFHCCAYFLMCLPAFSLPAQQRSFPTYPSVHKRWHMRHPVLHSAFFN